MMARQKFPSDDLAQFMVRMPPDLRDRIKTYAERHGRSMNTEIVRILEREFPAPFPLATRITELLELTRKLREHVEGDQIDALGNNLLEVIKGIASGTVQGVDEATRESVAEWLVEWEQSVSETVDDGYRESFDEEELISYHRRGSTAKVVDQSEDDRT